MFNKNDLLQLKNTQAVYRVVMIAEDEGLHLETISSENGAQIPQKEREILYAPEKILHNYQKVTLRGCKGGSFFILPA
jgi:hypothetical protein